MSKPKVIVVDDSILQLNMTKDTLEEAGFDVITRDTALGTTAAIIKEQPNCVLMDVSMPALSGDQIVKLVKEKNLDIKILLHSGKTSDELKVLVNECGADGFIEKGTNPAELVFQVKSAIEG